MGELSSPSSFNHVLGAKAARNLVLCLDGTNSTFNSLKPSNVPLLYSLLSTDANQQLRYYQSGMGTYGPGGDAGGAGASYVGKVLDLAFAWNIGRHISDAYQFLVDNYRTGDQIFLFGFSRGAHTARALAGMLHKVGLLLPRGQETVKSAYATYLKGSTPSAAAFKVANSCEVRVAFLGCWDTVASVGALTATCLPFARGTSAIATFRHCLSLDERRVRFCPQVWTNPTPSKALNGTLYHTSVKERWFSGSHRDIGGGRGAPDEDGHAPPRLSSITLRWMLLEAHKHGLKLDYHAVVSSPAYKDFIDSESSADVSLARTLRLAMEPSPQLSTDALAPREDKLSFSIKAEPSIGARIKGIGARGVQRLETVAWWILEFLPLSRVVWDFETRQRTWTNNPHFGHGRVLPADAVLHESVRVRLAAKPDEFAPGDSEGVTERMYTPQATFPRRNPLTTADFGV